MVIKKWFALSSAAITLFSFLACVKQPEGNQNMPFVRDELVNSLEGIRLWLMKNNADAAVQLQPGLSMSEINERVKNLPFRLPEDVYALYEWRNGTGSNDEIPFFWYHSFLSLDKALEHYRSNLKAYPDWKPSWFPLFYFQNEYYFIDCSPGENRYLPIRFYFDEDPKALVAYNNLTAMMKTASEWYTSGAVKLVDAKTMKLEEDLPRLRAIHQKYNPGVLFPYHVSEDRN